MTRCMGEQIPMKEASSDVDTVKWRIQITSVIAYFRLDRHVQCTNKMLKIYRICD